MGVSQTTHTKIKRVPNYNFRFFMANSHNSTVEAKYITPV